LKNIRKLVKEFEKEIKQVERRKAKEKRKEIKLNLEVKKFKRSELPGKYTTKILFE